MKRTTQWGISLLVLLGLAVPEIGSPKQVDPTGIIKELQGHQLIGIIAGEPEDARAVFEEVKTKQQKLYRAGDVVEGATIVEIKRQQVLLKRGEEIIQVHLAGGSPQERAPGDPIPVPVRPKDPRQALQQVLGQETPPYDSRVDKRAVSRPEIDRFVQFLQGQTPETITPVTTSIGPAIHMDRLDRDLLVTLGLEPSDLIVGISGMGIDTPDRLTQILGILNGATVFNLSVLRGNVVQPLYYTVQSEQ
ncbi:MAG TPA: hypothetical protein VJK28_00090 [Nitrospiria bacterium]|nr:hypothetical protein [Nitrospiria bacterium]